MVSIMEPVTPLTAQHTCDILWNNVLKVSLNTVTKVPTNVFLLCFGLLFNLFPVQSKPAPWGFSPETVLLFPHVRPSSTSFLLMFWVSILLFEPLTNQSTFLHYFSFPYCSSIEIHFASSYSTILYSVVLMMQLSVFLLTLLLYTQRDFKSSSEIGALVGIVCMTLR